MAWTVLGVPIDCVGAASPEAPAFGTELAPAALGAAGLLTALGADDGGVLDLRLVGETRDPGTGLVGGETVMGATTSVRTVVAEALRAGQRPLLVGGCCTLVPGAVAGIRDALGQPGLVYVDGHLDLYTEVTSPTGEAADLPVALMLGHGPVAWLESLGSTPLLPAEALVLVGYRDVDEARGLGSLLPDDVPGLHAPDVDAVRADPARVGVRAATRAAQGGRPVWLHLDVDVLDELAFPATDYLMPGGLSLAEVTELLRAVSETVPLVGASVGCYNPTKDPAGTSAKDLVSLLAASLDC